MINDNEDEQLIERFRALKETISESPPTILSFDPQLFQDITEKVIVGAKGDVVFQLLDGLQLRQAIKGVI